MKYIKILAAALATLSLAACSDNDDKRQTNTASGVTVYMENSQMRFREKSGIVTVPVAVQGTSNGYITLTCTVEEYGTEPAMEDVHYYMTAKTINIEPGATSAKFELATVDDSEINENRTFVIKLVEVKGAAIGNPSECVVTIRDDDSAPYDRVSGEWKCSCLNFDGKPQTLTVNFKPYEEGEAGFNTFYVVEGLVPVNVNAEFAYDELKGTGMVSIKYGQESTFTQEETTYPTLLAYLNGNSIVDSGTVEFTWNSDFTKLTIQSGPQGDYADFVELVSLSGGYGILDGTMNVTEFTR